MYLGNSGDVFCEFLVTHKKSSTENMKSVLAILAGILVTLAVLFTIPQLLILVVIVWGLVIYFVKLQSFEYEYSFTAGDLDIDKIAGNSRRKRVYSISLTEAEIVAPEDSYELDNFKYGQMKEYDFSANDPQVKNYILIGNHNGEHVRMKFTPNEKMVDHMRMTAPSKVKKN
jgi:hypothetical protein